MPNITFAVEASALANAKAYVSERSTTLNKLVNAYLKSLGQSQPRRAVSKADEVLLDYSLGKISLMQAAQSLGVRDAGHVLALIRQAGLPMPQLADAVVGEQVAANLEFFRQVRSASRANKGKRTAKRQ